MTDPRPDRLNLGADAAAVREGTAAVVYVLIRKDGDWWLAAGQNTPIRPPAR